MGAREIDQNLSAEENVAIARTKALAGAVMCMRLARILAEIEAETPTNIIPMPQPARPFAPPATPEWEALMKL